MVLMTKDLYILADGVAEGRRVFANTIKYVLMGTSSNFGNMFSAAAASLFLSFLPMLPTQILLNNLLYDVSELTIRPTTSTRNCSPGRSMGHRHDPPIHGLFRPDHQCLRLPDLLRDAASVRRRPDAVSLRLVRGSLATQTLVSSSSAPAACRSGRAAEPGAPSDDVLCAAVAVAIPYIPLIAHRWDSRPCRHFLVVLLVIIVTYLALAQIGVALFFAPPRSRPLARPGIPRERRIRRRSARWSLWRPVTARRIHRPTPAGKP